MASDVFICHTPADAPLAEKVRESLEAQGIQTWVASRHVVLGEEPADSILRGIESCPIMVLVFSRSANDSEPVRREVECALRADKVLIPLRVENISPTGAMETYLRRRYWHEAHTPALDRHLEELARVLKPLTKQRKVLMTEDDSISRTLPSRASILRRSNALPAPSAGGESAGPVKISLGFPDGIAAGGVSICECQVENSGSARMERFELLLESRGLKHGVTKTLGELPAGATQRHPLEIEPVRSGNYALHLTVKWREGATQFVWVGIRDLSVSEPCPRNELMRRTQTLPEAADPPRDAERAAANDPSQPEYPAELEPLELSPDYEVSVEAQERAAQSGALQIPEVCLDWGQSGMALKLEPIEASADMPCQEIRLIARPSFNLGRSQEESDFLLWFWPRNDVHDTKTRRISKKHCTLKAGKGKFHVVNTAAASLTTFDGQDLTGPEGAMLERHGVLNLSGIYSLDVTRFPASCPQGPAISNLADWKATGAGAATIPTSGSGSVRFVPLTPNVLLQQATWLLTDGTFGTSRANPILIDAPGLAEIQGRFHHYRGTFWIESFAANAAVQVDGNVLEPGSIVPLAGGQNVKLGEKNFYVSVAP